MVITKTDHRDYISSSHWQQRRKSFLEWNIACNRCKMPRWLAEIVYDQDLNVHHISYANKGNEQDEDLEALCRRCHDIEKFGRSSLREPKSSICEKCGGKHWNPYNSICEPCTHRLEKVLCCQCERLYIPRDSFLICDFCMEIRGGDVERIFYSFEQILPGPKRMTVGKFTLLNICMYYMGAKNVRTMVDEIECLVDELLARKLKK